MREIDNRMTADKIRERLSDIARISGDNEVAHSEEDRLWRDVLATIASNRFNPDWKLAEAALKSREIDYIRWYA